MITRFSLSPSAQPLRYPLSRRAYPWQQHVTEGPDWLFYVSLGALTEFISGLHHQFHNKHITIPHEPLLSEPISIYSIALFADFE